MSLYKAIEHGKEHRKSWTTKKDRAKSIDGTCRNHGSCDWCKFNRLYQFRKESQKTDDILKEYKKED